MKKKTLPGFLGVSRRLVGRWIFIDSTFIANLSRARHCASCGDREVKNRYGLHPPEIPKYWADKQQAVNSPGSNLETDMGSNPDSATFWLCDLGQHLFSEPQLPPLKNGNCNSPASQE